MGARYLVDRSRHSQKTKGKDWVRPDGMATMCQQDADILRQEVVSRDVKSVLEFGPGNSTDVFHELGLHITSIEHSDKWYPVAVERFKDLPNIRVLKGEDEMPFRVPELDRDERFDLAFVDAPQGYMPLRKVHKGYEDCSRLNTTLFALERCQVVFLHDTKRPLEKGTLWRLRRLGYHVEQMKTSYGIARITHNGGQARPDLSGVAEPGGTPAGASP
jgi:hypothetical protein